MLLTCEGTAYEISGPRCAPWVILIHGLGLTSFITWREIIPILADEFRVLSYDLLGHGETVLLKQELNLNIMAKQVIALMDFLSIDKAALVGFSLGGMINRRVAIDYPDRVSALVILNSPHKRSTQQQKQVEERARVSSSNGPFALIDATLERWFTPAFLKNNSNVVASVREIVLANDPMNYSNFRKVLANGVLELVCPNPKLSIPTCVMTCENDIGSTPEMSKSIAREIMPSEIFIFPHLQHLGILEEPKIFADRILAFLKTRLHLPLKGC